jgi:histone H3/H4
MSAAKTNRERPTHESQSGAAFEQTIERLRTGLAKHGQPQNLSTNAVAVLLERQAEYVEEVGSEAIRIAKRNRADFVSGADVESADRRLRGTSLPGTRALACTMGAATFGAGLSEFITIMTTAHPGHLGIGLGCGGMVGGLLGVAYGLLRGR